MDVSTLANLINACVVTTGIIFAAAQISYYPSTKTKGSNARAGKIIPKLGLHQCTSAALGYLRVKRTASSRSRCFLQRLLQHDLRSPLIVRREMHVREHPAHERQAEAAFLATASIRLRSGLFLSDARAVMPDDEANEGR